MTNTNAEALKAAFAAADEGNPVPLVELYSDEMTWAGFTLEGTLRLYTKAEFLEPSASWPSSTNPATRSSPSTSSVTTW